MPSKATSWFYTEQARTRTSLGGEHHAFLDSPLARFLAPISPRFFLRLPSLMELLNPYLPMLFIVNVVRSLLAGTCFYLAYKLLRDMPASRGYQKESGTQIFADERR